MNLTTYMKDGAGYQARAILACLQGTIGDGLEKSWNETTLRYDANISIARWENCREQGYVVSMRNKDYSKQINIAFFEHRNSDSVCAVAWEQITINAPTIESAVFGDVYKDKWDVSVLFDYGEYIKMSSWIKDHLESFWCK